MLQIRWLAGQMDKCAEMAEWVYHEFSYEFADQTLDEWQRSFAAGQSDGSWTSLIATENGHLLGGATLAVSDLPERPDLGPWLACVFVTPQARRTGVAAKLIAGVCDRAKSEGVRTLYLHTHSQADYYSTLGWEVMETFEAWDKKQYLMTRRL